MPDSTFPLIQETAKQAGLTLSPATLAKLDEFVSLLSHWAKKISLTADPSPTQIIKHHLPDAFMLSAMLSDQLPSTAQILDAGSGGGLPAIPLSILHPDVHFTLVEATKRKCALLQTAAHQLNLRVSVLAERIEDVPAQFFDLAMSRATWAPDKWLDIATNFIGPGGLVAVFIAQQENIPQPSPALSLIKQQQYVIPPATPRTLVIFQKSQ